jgi:regulator of replication initiation timing
MPNLKGHSDSIKDSRFKAAWQSGPTRTIRVPIALAEVTLEYARQFDRGNESRDTAKKPDNKTSVDIAEPRDTGNTVSSKPSANANETLDTMFKEEVETAPAEIEIDRANIAQQPDSKLFPLMETVQSEIESFEQQLRSQSRRLEEQDQELLKLHERNGDLEFEVQNLKEQLEKECASREENKKSAPAEKDLPDAADLLNKLKAKRKKSKTDLADLEVILELLES